MNKNLVRQSHSNPDFNKLNEMVCYLRKTLNLLPSCDEWRVKYDEILNFQADDGSFNLFDSFKVESDARVDYCFIPTYLCTAIIMKGLMNGNYSYDSIATVLSKALHICCLRNLEGHGYNSISGQVEAMKIFLCANVSDFIIKYPNICPDFNALINKIIKRYEYAIAKGTYIFDYGTNCKMEFIEIVRQFHKRTNIFVYGTLLRGRRNYDSFLAPLKPISTGTIEGYDMYDLGSYPGIIPGNSKIFGEIYQINNRRLDEIDRLEGEGYLYTKELTNVTTEDGETIPAYVYVYNHSVDNCEKIPFENQPYGKDDFVWYVSYGSNMLTDRLKYYIVGGHCELNGRNYVGCTDKSMPINSTSVTIPYDMFYSNYNQGSWKNSSVSFLDLSHVGHSLGRAYLIKKNQFATIHEQEGTGYNWYPDIVRLSDIDGMPAYTFSNKKDKQHEPFSTVSDDYKNVLINGIKETYPNMTENDILNYLKAYEK